MILPGGNGNIPPLVNPQIPPSQPGPLPTVPAPPYPEETPTAPAMVSWAPGVGAPSSTCSAIGFDNVSSNLLFCLLYSNNVLFLLAV